MWMCQYSWSHKHMHNLWIIYVSLHTYAMQYMLSSIAKTAAQRKGKNLSWHKLSWQSMLLHKHTPQTSCRSHRCLSWSRWCGICPCRTPPRWWQTWQWQRKAAGRFEAEEPWLSLWTSTPPGDLRDRERWGRVDSSECWQQYNKQQQTKI